MPVEPLPVQNQDRSSDKLRSPSKPIDFSKPIEKDNLKGKNALVSGGANGIGAGFVEALAEAGASVTIADLKDDLGHAKRLQEKGYKVQFVEADMRSFDSQVKCFDSAVAFSNSKSLDLVCAVAGVAGHSILDWLNKQKPHETPVAPPTIDIDVNLTGVYFTTHLAMHYFQQPPAEGFQVPESRQLIFVSSLAGYLNLPFTADYAAAKFGVRGMWRSLRTNPRALGQSAPAFRTNLLAPTFIQTNMIKGKEPILDKMGAKYGQISDVVKAMMRLACDESIFGRAIAVCQEDGSFDLCDDEQGHDAGASLEKAMAKGGILNGLTGLAVAAATASVSDD